MRPTAKEPGYLRPEDLYSRNGFVMRSGISESRLHQAKRQHGLAPKYINCGKRKFIRGADAIRFIERLAEIEE